MAKERPRELTFAFSALRRGVDMNKSNEDGAFIRGYLGGVVESVLDYLARYDMAQGYVDSNLDKEVEKMDNG